MNPLPFVLASTEHGAMIVNHLDQHRLPSGEAYGVGCQLLNNGAYDLADVNFIKRILVKIHAEKGPGLLTLDCGANIGVHSLEMGRCLGSQGQVLAFEAQERLFYALCGNIALANLFNVSAHFTALGAESGTLSIPKPNYLRPASFGSLELRRRKDTEYIGQNISYMPRDLVQVPLITIDSLNLDRCDFIKLDVEGMELEVLKGALETLRHFMPSMWIEWIKSDKEVLYTFLKDLGYDIKEFGMNLFCEKICVREREQAKNND